MYLLLLKVALGASIDSFWCAKDATGALRCNRCANDAFWCANDATGALTMHFGALYLVEWYFLK